MVERIVRSIKKEINIMSEAERRQRLAYKQNRKKRIIIQLVALAVVAMILLGSIITYIQLNKTYYISYTEHSGVDYKVDLKPNEFYDKDSLEDGRVYVASLIDNIKADFTYRLDMGVAGIDYDYSYNIEAELLISDKAGTPIFNPIYKLKNVNDVQHNSDDALIINEDIIVNYDQYNAIAKEFVANYELKDVVSVLAIKMNVDVIGDCEGLEGNGCNTYTATLNVPLNVNTVDINTQTSSADGTSKVFAYGTAVNKNIFLIAAIVAGVIEVALAVILVIYTYKTRNEDINYTNKIRKLLSNYGSFIQQLDNEFDTTGYQVLRIKSFDQMLNIRDTLQSPILMHENDDKTMSSFVIMSNANAIYLFEIKVDNYDVIYGIESEQA